MNANSRDARRLLGLQAVLVVIVATTYLVIGGFNEVVAALYGGAVAMLHTWMLSRRVRLALEVARTNPGRETMVLYLGALQRFAMTLCLFLLGMGWIGVEPIPVIIAFAVAQAAFFIGGGTAKMGSKARVENL